MESVQEVKSISKGARVSMETCSGFTLAQATGKHFKQMLWKYLGKIIKS